MIIGINGYAGSGKDTVGTIIQYLQADTNIHLKDVLKKTPHHIWWLEERSGWEIKKWAGKLKVIASLLTGIPVEKFEDQEFKKVLLGPEWGTVTLTPLSSIPVFANIEFNSLMSVRDFLQKLGTDAIRDNLHINTWVNALMVDYSPTGDTLLEGEVRKVREEDLIYPNWIVTDTRFPNEAEAIKKADGIIIRVERPGVKPINPHPSETGLDDWKFDYVINNDGSLKDLIKKVNKILKKENILK
jgi:hypothetical protein